MLNMQGRYLVGLGLVLGVVYAGCKNDPTPQVAGSGGAAGSQEADAGSVGASVGGSGGTNASATGGTEAGQGQLGTSGGSGGKGGNGDKGGGAGEEASASGGEAPGASGANDESGGSGGKGGGAGTAGAGAGTWPKVYGGNGEDQVADVLIDDEGYIYVGGWTASDDYDLASTGRDEPGLTDAWLFKLDPEGNIVWSQVYDLPEWDSSEHITDLEFLDDDYIIVGGNVVDDDGANQYDKDAFVLRVSRSSGQALFSARLSGVDAENIDLDKDEDVVRVRGARSFTNNTYYTYEVLGGTVTRDSGPFGPGHTDMDAYYAQVYEPEPTPLGPTPPDYAVLYGARGGPETFNFFTLGGAIGITAAANEGDFEEWYGQLEGWSDVFFVDFTEERVTDLVLAPGGERLNAMDGNAFAGASDSWEGAVPCIANEDDQADVWVGRFTGSGRFGMGCFGAPGKDEGIAVFDLDDDGLIVVGNAASPGSGDLSSLTLTDDSFVARVNNAYELVSVKGVPAPKVGTDATAAAAAARAPDGSIIVVGYSHNRPSEDSPVHGIQADIWVTRVLPD